MDLKEQLKQVLSAAEALGAVANARDPHVMNCVADEPDPITTAVEEAVSSSLAVVKLLQQEA